IPNAPYGFVRTSIGQEAPLKCSKPGPEPWMIGNHLYRRVVDFKPTLTRKTLNIEAAGYVSREDLEHNQRNQRAKAQCRRDRSSTRQISIQEDNEPNYQCHERDDDAPSRICHDHCGHAEE